MRARASACESIIRLLASACLSVRKCQIDSHTALLSVYVFELEVIAVVHAEARRRIGKADPILGRIRGSGDLRSVVLQAEIELAVLAMRTKSDLASSRNS